MTRQYDTLNDKLFLTLFILDLQMVEDDYIHNTIQLTHTDTHKKKHFSTNQPSWKECYRTQKCQEGALIHCIFKNHLEVFHFFSRSLFQHRVIYTYDQPDLTALDMQAEVKSTGCVLHSNTLR